MRQRKDERMKKSDQIRHNLYIIRMIMKVSPSRVWMTMLYEVLTNVYNILFTVVFFAYFVQCVIDQKPIGFMITVAGAVTICGLLVEAFGGWYRTIYIKQSDLKITCAIKTMIYEKVNTLDYKCYDDPEYYDNFVYSIGEIPTKSTEILGDVFSALGMGVGVVILMAFFWFVDVSIVVLSFFFLLLSLYLGKRINQEVFLYTKRVIPYQRKLGYINRVLIQHEYAKELRITEVARPLRGMIKEGARGIRNLNQQQYKKVALLNAASLLFGFGLTTCVATLIAVYKIVIQKTLSVAFYFPMISALAEFSYRSVAFVNSVNKLMANSLYIEKFRTFMAYEPRIVSIPDAVRPGKFEELEVRNVSFRYQSMSKDALHHINLNIKKGEKIALVGKNGSGKTTLVHLLLRLYDPDQGQLLYNGLDIRKLELEVYRDRFGIVFQDFNLYADTIRNNLFLGGESKNEEEISQIIREFGLENKIRALPDGMDTQLTRELSEDGVLLSGGQSQALAICRIYLTDHDIFILDEPTSALDPMAEAKFFENIKNIAAEKTVLFISHRLSSAKIADRIYMMEDGEIVEYGTHAQLMELDQKYAEMFEIQSQYYSQEGLCGVGYEK